MVPVHRSTGTPQLHFIPRSLFGKQPKLLKKVSGSTIPCLHRHLAAVLCSTLTFGVKHDRFYSGELGQTQLFSASVASFAVAGMIDSFKVGC